MTIGPGSIKKPVAKRLRSNCCPCGVSDSRDIEAFIRRTRPERHPGGQMVRKRHRNFLFAIGVAQNFVVDRAEVLIPMTIEEP